VGAFGTDVPDVVAAETAGLVAPLDVADEEDEGETDPPPDDVFLLLLSLFLFPALPNKLFFCADNDIVMQKGK
jgi:hypothetical protein